MDTVPKKKSEIPISAPDDDQNTQQEPTSPSEAAQVDRLEELMEQLSDDDLTGVFFGGC